MCWKLSMFTPWQCIRFFNLRHLVWYFWNRQTVVCQLPPSAIPPFWRHSAYIVIYASYIWPKITLYGVWYAPWRLRLTFVKIRGVPLWLRRFWLVYEAVRAQSIPACRMLLLPIVFFSLPVPRYTFRQWWQHWHGPPVLSQWELEVEPTTRQVYSHCHLTPSHVTMSSTQSLSQRKENNQKKTVVCD